MSLISFPHPIHFVLLHIRAKCDPRQHPRQCHEKEPLPLVHVLLGFIHGQDLAVVLRNFEERYRMKAFCLVHSFFRGVRPVLLFADRVEHQVVLLPVEHVGPLFVAVVDHDIRAERFARLSLFHAPRVVVGRSRARDKRAGVFRELNRERADRGRATDDAQFLTR